jgi:thiol-disulfide isomerase/thioredoxin
MAVLTIHDEGRRYRFERLSLPMVLSDMRFRPGDPAPGDRFPEFDLPMIDGGRFRHADLGTPPVTLIAFGSSTCPVTDDAAPGLNELHRRFGGCVRFVMVNVREAHPGDAVPQPVTIGTKTAHARRLRDLHGFRFEIAVDDVNGTLHRAVSPKPNSAYILGRNRAILFRAQWANDTSALAEALNAIVRGRRLRRSHTGGVIAPMLRMLRNIAPVLDRAGCGAWADMWRVAPPLAAIAFIFKWFGVRPRSRASAVAAAVPDCDAL